jgi:hypothetical protein
MSQILKTKVVCSSETSANFCMTTSCLVPEDSTLRDDRCERLKSEKKNRMERNRWMDVSKVWEIVKNAYGICVTPSIHILSNRVTKFSILKLPTLDIFYLLLAESWESRSAATFFHTVIINPLLHDRWIITSRTENGVCKPAQLKNICFNWWITSLLTSVS